MMTDPLVAAFNAGVLAKAAQEAARGIRENGVPDSGEAMADWLEEIAASLAAPYDIGYKKLNDSKEYDDE